MVDPSKCPNCGFTAHSLPSEDTKFRILDCDKCGTCRISMEAQIELAKNPIMKASLFYELSKSGPNKMLNIYLEGETLIGDIVNKVDFIS